MKEFIIIKGKQDSGKTTTAWCVYQRLLPYSSHKQMYIGGNSVNNHGDIVYEPAPRNNRPKDFKVILYGVFGYKVAIISAGDYSNQLQQDIASVMAQKVDYIVISLRTVNRAGSSRRMIKQTYPNIIQREFRVSAPKVTFTHPLDIVNSKRQIADKIVNYILLQTTYFKF